METRTGCDWFTATTDSPDVGGVWYNDVYKPHKDLCGTEPDTEEFYGFRGLKVGGMAWLYRAKDQRYMLVCSGSEAGYWLSYAGSGKFTRLDLQTTVFLQKAQPMYILEQWHHVKPSVSPARVARYVEDKRSGDTLYLGSRLSEKFGRLYDKGVEEKSSAPGRIIRYEVELKGGMAQGIGQILVNSGMCLGEEEVSISSFVHDFFSQRQVKPLFKRGDGKLDFKVGRPSKSDEKTLEWIQKTVSPCIWRLISKGYAQNVSDALGLSVLVDKFGEVHYRDNEL